LLRLTAGFRPVDLSIQFLILPWKNAEIHYETHPIQNIFQMAVIPPILQDSTQSKPSRRISFSKAAFNDIVFVDIPSPQKRKCVTDHYIQPGSRLQDRLFCGKKTYHPMKKRYDLPMKNRISMIST
jgi:hypothetical protein